MYLCMYVCVCMYVFMYVCVCVYVCMTILYVNGPALISMYLTLSSRFKCYISDVWLGAEIAQSL
jgi:type IV secretory pathway VirB3-like protein